MVKISTPEQSLAEELAEYSLRKRFWIFSAARHIAKVNELRQKFEELESEVAELEYEELEVSKNGKRK